jgi:hypothetical protein
VDNKDNLLVDEYLDLYLSGKDIGHFLDFTNAGGSQNVPQADKLRHERRASSGYINDKIIHINRANCVLLFEGYWNIHTNCILCIGMSFLTEH